MKDPTNVRFIVFLRFIKWRECLSERNKQILLGAATNTAKITL